MNQCITLAYAKVILQRHEQRLSKHSTYVFDIQGVSVNMANKVVGREIRGKEYKNQKQNVMTNVESDVLYQESGDNGAQYNQVRGRGRVFNKPKVIYRVCGKAGHTALQCYHRFDTSYVGNGSNCGGGYRTRNFQTQFEVIILKRLMLEEWGILEQII